MESNITIARDAVFAKTARRMAWLAARSGEEAIDFPRVALEEADRALFHTLFDEAAMRAIDLCRPFLSSASNTDEALTLRLTLPDAPDAATLAMSLEQMLTAHVLGEWQEIVCPDRAAASFARSDEAAAKASAILYHHPAPVRLPK